MDQWKWAGDEGLYRTRQRVRRCHPSGCVSSHMISVACVATHGCPHVLMHASFTCQMTAPTSRWLAAWLECMRCDTPASACRFACAYRRYFDTSSYDLSSCMSSTHARLPLLLFLTLSCWYARQNVLAICIETPRASWSVYAIFDPSGIFSTRDQSRIFFRSRSDELNIINRLQNISDLEEKYFPSLQLPRKIS